MIRFPHTAPPKTDGGYIGFGGSAAASRSPHSTFVSLGGECGWGPEAPSLIRPSTPAGRLQALNAKDQLAGRINGRARTLICCRIGYPGAARVRSVLDPSGMRRRIGAVAYRRRRSRKPQGPAVSRLGYVSLGQADVRRRVGGCLIPRRRRRPPHGPGRARERHPVGSRPG